MRSTILAVTKTLITGLSGVGKSTTIGALRERGFTAYDADYGDLSLQQDGDWIWNLDRFTELLDTAGDEPFFLSGAAPNMGQLRHRFDHVVLLAVSTEVMAERMIHRTTNVYGKDPADRATAVSYKETVEPLLRKGATLEIDTSAPVAAVVSAILAHAGIAAR